MKLRVHITRLSRAPMGGDIVLRRLLGLQHTEFARSGQPWLEVSGLTPGQCAAYCGMFRNRKLPETMFEVMGTREERAAVDKFRRDVESEIAARSES